MPGAQLWWIEVPVESSRSLCFRLSLLARSSRLPTAYQASWQSSKPTFAAVSASWNNSMWTMSFSPKVFLRTAIDITSARGSVGGGWRSRSASTLNGWEPTLTATWAGLERKRHHYCIECSFIFHRPLKQLHILGAITQLMRHDQHVHVTGGTLITSLWRWEAFSESVTTTQQGTSDWHFCCQEDWVVTISCLGWKAVGCLLPTSSVFQRLQAWAIRYNMME